ncbi:YeeE/YedE thiosulfate transporter family protein [Candidatus Berkiella aquae]|uniref:YeeE/YedE family protein n=1 Tax=Candidatus Berkiella aquae TaxID=295108 RepID=A0A0Q9YX96_9GAMM|nr:YeeE/YedE family protein [Candidatus Berkiella aquae]MCS5711480.1 YeeE/YedE family protein [Candidatus Berkiella aquae]
MLIDWENFTPWLSLLGGVLIGIATSLLLLVNGKIAGISGILGGLLRLPRGDMSWRILFLLGMISAPIFYRFIIGDPTINIEADWLMNIIAGIFVGIGTRISSGCTSGHGVCGLSRLSLRSLIATLTFMCIGIITVFIVRHILGGR